MWNRGLTKKGRLVIVKYRWRLPVCHYPCGFSKFRYSSHKNEPICLVQLREKTFQWILSETFCKNSPRLPSVTCCNIFCFPYHNGKIEVSPFGKNKWTYSHLRYFHHHTFCNSTGWRTYNEFFNPSHEKLRHHVNSSSEVRLDSKF